MTAELIEGMRSVRVPFSLDVVVAAAVSAANTQGSTPKAFGVGFGC
jgi:histidinol-phosphate/aromatic aminotransferase/cobyric acid decarboxylase-like protein